MSEHDESKVVEAVHKRLFIGGKWLDATDGRTFDVVDPATGKTLCAVADASPDDGRAALDAAVAAQPDFAAMAPRDRADILTRAFELLHERIDDLALLMTLEMGKPLAEARGEIAYAAEFFRHFAERGRPDRRRLSDGARRRGALPGGPSTRRPVSADHAVELPDGDGHPQAGAGHRRRMHQRDQAGPPDPAVDAGVDGHPGRRRRCPQAWSTASRSTDAVR